MGGGAPRAAALRASARGRPAGSAPLPLPSSSSSSPSPLPGEIGPPAGRVGLLPAAAGSKLPGAPGTSPAFPTGSRGAGTAGVHRRAWAAPCVPVCAGRARGAAAAAAAGAEPGSSYLPPRSGCPGGREAPDRWAAVVLSARRDLRLAGLRRGSPAEGPRRPVRFRAGCGRARAVRAPPHTRRSQHTDTPEPFSSGKKREKSV